jgi:pimeloyl-ACP methyl ester carboxylesterase
LANAAVDSLSGGLNCANNHARFTNASGGHHKCKPMTCIDTLKDWSVVDRLHRITQPALVISGRHDEVPPAVAAQIRRALPNAEIKVFPNSSHTPFFEEPEAYFAVLGDFLDRNRG